MKFSLATLTLTTLLALGAGVVHAQDDEPTAEKAAEKAAGDETGKAAARAARIARKRAFLVVFFKGLLEEALPRLGD